MPENREDALYPVVFQDHDGSWTWSIESGKAFEASHRVHATNNGYETQGDARAAVKVRLAELVASRSKGAAAEQAAAVVPAAPPTKATAADESATTPLPEWGVYASGSLLAIFADKQLAQTFCKAQSGRKCSIKRVRYGVVPSE